MTKIEGNIDRFEGEKAVIRTEGGELIVPKKYLREFKEGDPVAVNIKRSRPKNKTQKLLKEIFKK